MNANAKRKWIVIIAGVLAALLLVQVSRRLERSRRPPPVAKRVEQLRSLSDSFAWVAQQAGDAVVNVYADHRIEGREMISPFDFFFGGSRRRIPLRAPDRIYTSLGSGVIVDKRGYVLTNHHVIENADSVRVRTADGRTFRARIVGSDPQTDVAVLKISGRGIEAAELGDSDAVRVGDWVVAIGNPFGLSHTVTAGIISAKGRAGVGVAYYEDFLQTDAAINPGNSGGPLLDLDARVIGINTAIATRTGGYQGVGFAIPINLAYGVMESILDRGHVDRGFLGVLIQDLTPELARGLGIDAEEGALVSQVLPGGPAEAAGLRDGDVVVRFDGRRVRGANALRNMLATTPPGTEVKIRVVRPEGPEDLVATIGSPDDMDRIDAAARGTPWEALGFEVREIDPAEAQAAGAPEARIVVVRVRAGGIAAEGGLLADDLILEVQRRPVRTLDELREALESSGRETILLRVSTGGRRRFVVLRNR